MYMFFQQLANAVKQAYAGRPDLESHLQSARTARAWLESLEIDPRLGQSLVEQIEVLEIAFQDLLRN